MTPADDSTNNSSGAPEGAKLNGPGSPKDPARQIIRLDDFIKRSGLVGTGGEAKLRIQGGEIFVNGEIETRRRKQLSVGDLVEVLGETLEVTADCFD